MSQIHKPISKKKKVVREIAKVASGILIPVASKLVGVDLIRPVTDLLKLIF